MQGETGQLLAPGQADAPLPSLSRNSTSSNSSSDSVSSTWSSSFAVPLSPASSTTGSATGGVKGKAMSSRPNVIRRSSKDCADGISLAEWQRCLPQANSESAPPPLRTFEPVGHSASSDRTDSVRSTMWSSSVPKVSFSSVLPPPMRSWTMETANGDASSVMSSSSSGIMSSSSSGSACSVQMPVTPPSVPFLPTRMSPAGCSIQVQDHDQCEYVIIAHLPGFAHENITVALKRNGSLHILADRWDDRDPFAFLDSKKPPQPPRPLPPYSLQSVSTTTMSNNGGSPGPSHFERLIELGPDAIGGKARASWDGKATLTVRVSRRTPEAWERKDTSRTRP